MKRTIKWICLFLCVVLVFGMFAKPALATYASELTNSVIKEKEQEIDKAKQEKKQLQNSLTDVKKLKEQLEKSKQDLTVYVQELDADLTAIQEKINELNDLITEKEKEAILSHMFPLGPLPKTQEAWIITGADKLCACVEVFHIGIALTRSGRVVVSAA